MNEMGHKECNGKRQWTLLPFEALREVVDVLTINAETKYARNNWSLVEDGTTKYMDATLRHIDAWLTGEKKDPEDGKSHLAHAICDLLFALWFELTGKEKGAKIESLQPGLIPAEPPRLWTDDTLAALASTLSQDQIHAFMRPRLPHEMRMAYEYNGKRLTDADVAILRDILAKRKAKK